MAENLENQLSKCILRNNCDNNNSDDDLGDEHPKQIIEKYPNKTIGSIQIFNSNQVHIGDVTNINGPVIINKIITRDPGELSEKLAKIDNPRFSIVNRMNWLAQPPIEKPELFREPVKYVVISHSATEEAFTRSDNVLTVRLIQNFHIESRKWSDISYNFLIGGDGSVFEGRGWEIVGAHALRPYNEISLGLNFIGYFSYKLPQEVALEKAKSLIKFGVEIGAISPDYRILGHCQCTSTESPGRRLFQEIQTWDRWDSTVSLTNPSSLIVKKY